MLEVGLRMSGERVGQALDRILTGVSGMVDGTQCHTIHSRGQDFTMKQRPESFRIRAFCFRLRDAFPCPFPMFPLVSMLAVFPSRVSEATSLYGSSRGMPTRKNPRLFCYSSHRDCSHTGWS